MIVHYEGISGDAKVWIFQAKELISDELISKIEYDLHAFLDEWVSHKEQFPSFAGIFYRKFLVLIADNSITHIGGCSQDSMMHHIDYLENKYNIILKDRTQVAYLDTENNVRSLHLNDLKGAFEEGIIDKSTIVFDNLVKTKHDFETSWKKSLSESWHMRFV
ncbi:MAG: hypothetical protein R2774_12945 [Saprospiraceae bacterium]